MSDRTMPSPVNSTPNRGLILSVVFTVLVGCDQPIYESVPYAPPSLGFEFDQPQNNARHNWPIHGTAMTIAKPPPFAYMSSLDERIQLPPFELPDRSEWDSEDLPESVREILENILTPIAHDTDWDGTIEATDFAGPQAFDMSQDGNRIVTVKDQHFALFDASNGKLIGRRKLPGNWGNDPPTAVRFAPETKDFLVASKSKLCRISSKNGGLTQEIRGPGEELKKWLVADDESYMVALTESGKLYGGDAQLDQFGPLKLGGTSSDQTYEDVGMSLDGVRVLVAVDNAPRTYLQDGGNIVDFIEYPDTQFENPPLISGGLREDIWARERSIFFTQAISGPYCDREFDTDAPTELKLSSAHERETKTRNLFWKPHWIQAVRSPPGISGEWAVAVSQHLSNGTMQWVMHDMNIWSRANSVGRPLDSLPERIVVDRLARHVALVDSDTIRLDKWNSWNSRDEYENESKLESLLKENLTEFEAACESLHQTDYWTRLGCSADVLNTYISSAANKWATWEQEREKDASELDEETASILDRLDKWRDDGGFWARTVYAHQLYRRAWRAREGRDGIGGDRFTRYQSLRTKALQVMEALLEEDTPTATTLATYVACKLESDAQLETYERLCVRFLRMYPRSTLMASKLAFKLLPQWHGETGDAVGYLLAHARMYDEPYASLVFMLMVTEICPYLGGSQEHWWSFDKNMMDRGIDRAIELGMPASSWFYKCRKLQLMMAFRSNSEKEMASYLLKTNAVIPADRLLNESSTLYHDMPLWREIMDAAE